MNGRTRTTKLVEENWCYSWTNCGSECLTPPSKRSQKMKTGSVFALQRSFNIPSQHSSNFSSKWYPCLSKLDSFCVYFSTFGLVSPFSGTRLLGTKDVEVVVLPTALATPLLVAPCWCAASVLASMIGSFWLSSSLLANEEHFISEIRNRNQPL